MLLSNYSKFSSIEEVQGSSVGVQPTPTSFICDRVTGRTSDMEVYKGVPWLYTTNTYIEFSLPNSFMLSSYKREFSVPSHRPEIDNTILDLYNSIDFNLINNQFTEFNENFIFNNYGYVSDYRYKQFLNGGWRLFRGYSPVQNFEEFNSIWNVKNTISVMIILGVFVTNVDSLELKKKLFREGLEIS